ncbi:hypothetical protein Cci01nite_45830 [Catellatospora citrea]|uniref:Uncharacterized protein n=1 Tax=Catellatospora citrea TaxID=53366 RepID=A0A8J3KQI3_9ACTN|nr:hypothetical protein Cci01nite_45830 [Catellatospora citrea]
MGDPLAEPSLAGRAVDDLDVHVVVSLPVTGPPTLPPTRGTLLIAAYPQLGVGESEWAKPWLAAYYE